MRSLWMGIVPGPLVTRVLVLDGPQQTLLKARLPHAPEHPRALQALCEAMALWCGRAVRCALAAGESGASCAFSRWPDAVEAATGGPLYEIAIVPQVRAPRERDGLDGLGDFRDVRQLCLCEVAR
jgi:hypothetical protein